MPVVAVATLLAGLVYLGPLAPEVGAAAADQLTLQLSPPSILADGVSTTTATATVTLLGAPVVGETVQFSSTDSGEQISATTDNGDGTYTATITSSTTAGTATITATDTTALPLPLSTTQTLTQTPGPAANVTVGLSPPSLVANGSSTTTATATVTDAQGNGVPGDTVTFSPTPVGGQGAVSDHGDGTYTATIRSTTTAGPVQVTATDTTAGISNGAQLTQTAGPAASIVAGVAPSSIPADGTTPATVTATVADANGNPVAGDSIHFTSNLGGTSFAKATGTTNASGVYSTTVTGTGAGAATITATDTSAGNINDTASLTLTAGAGANVAVTAAPGSITADGVSGSTVTATVTDSQGNPVAGDSVHFTSSLGGVSFAQATGVTNGSGVYSTTVTGTTAGTATITATDTTAGNIAGTTALVLTAGPGANVAVTVTPGSIAANGVASSTVTATVTDAHGNHVPGDSVHFTSSLGGVSFAQATGVTNASGVYSTTVTGTTAGSATITATDTTAGISHGAPLVLTAGPAASLAVTFSQNPIAANGSNATTVTATVLDAHANPVPGNTIHFVSDLPHTSFGNATGTTNAQGQYSTTITSTQAGLATITATDSTAGGLNNSALLTVNPAAPQNIGLQPLGSLPANGTSTTTETATVTDMHGNPVAGEHLSFSAAPAGVAFSPGPWTTNAQGQVTVTITSSTVAGVVTITATDVTTGSAAPPVSTQLTLTPGPPANVGVSLSPASIVANGVSSTTATATVTDAHGNPIPSDSVSFTSSDPGEVAGSTIAGGNGLYTASIRSSTTVGTPTITATDDTAGISGRATLTQTAAVSTTTLSASPASAVTNQRVTLAATVQATSGAPGGIVAFRAGGTAIAGCGAVAVTASGSVGAATCVTSFAAANGPGPLTAVFTPSASTTLGSTSAPVTLVLAAAPSTTVVGVPSSARAGRPVHYSASVATTSTGAVAPAGTVSFFDGSRPVRACAKVSLSSGVAACTLTYARASAHVISARYAGDGNFAASSSAAAKTLVLPSPGVRRTVGSTMTWSFLRTKTNTKVVSLLVSRPPAGGAALLRCTGHGCPFASRTVPVPTHAKCATVRHRRRCTPQAPARLDLAPQFRGAELAPGTVLVVELTRRGYNGRYYRFDISSGSGPRSQIACIAPGRTKPNQGCTLP